MPAYDLTFLSDFLKQQQSKRGGFIFNRMIFKNMKILSSVPPTHLLSPIHLGHWLEQKHNRLLNCPLAFQVHSLSTHFVELPCLTQKTETKSLREPHAASPELRSMVGLPVPTLGVGSCSAPKAAAMEVRASLFRAWHGGLLSHSKQRSDAIVPGLSRLQKREGIFHMSFSSLALTCQRHIIRLCLVLKYKLGRNHKDKNLAESSTLQRFCILACTWGLEYQKRVCLPM